MGWDAEKEELEYKNEIKLEEMKAELSNKEIKINELQKKLLDQEKGFRDEIDKKAKEELRMNMELNQSIHDLQNYKETQEVEQEKNMKEKLLKLDQKCTLEENFQADLKLFIAEAVATHKTQWDAE